MQMLLMIIDQKVAVVLTARIAFTMLSLISRSTTKEDPFAAHVSQTVREMDQRIKTQHLMEKTKKKEKIRIRKKKKL